VAELTDDISMLHFIKAAVKQLQPIRRLIAERDRLTMECNTLNEKVHALAKRNARLAASMRQHPGQEPSVEDDDGADETWVPPGHFYSPIPSLEDISQWEDRIFNKTLPRLPAIELAETQQLALLRRLEPFYRDMPFTPEKSPGLRYYFKNDQFSYADAVFLFCMIRYLKPERIIEIGSGFSSALILDTNQLFFDGSIQCEFIEPFPNRLLRLLPNRDVKKIRLYKKKLQEIELDMFTSLHQGDILFIDSSHVCKTGSDVNTLIFEVLPLLPSGVHIHIHDIFYPFEYPKPWVLQGRAWNEAYIIRAFLEYNTVFRIELFVNFLQTFHQELIKDKFPLGLNNQGGSVWLEKAGV
jgi:hypothetical protein